MRHYLKFATRHIRRLIFDPRPSSLTSMSSSTRCWRRTTPLETREEPQLRLVNSYSREKEVFVPADRNRVTWYNCGPTVYDASHMGHARTYLSFDILRRVLQSYFGYRVFFVQNVTDIDDKIIKRARQNYLFDKYRADNKNGLDRVLDDTKNVLELFKKQMEKTEDEDKLAMQKRMLKEVSAALTKAESNLKEGKSEIETKEALLDASKDILAPWLDDQFGSEVNDNSIFSELPKYWEKKFNEDMANLNILPPSKLTRVSEYVPQIISFIQGIMANGYAYESNNSVYFDVIKFESNENHFYCKLMPTSAFGGDAKALAEGEGALQSSSSSEKRSEYDFALWKASKKGEPSWDSPWGQGRPGWHIECSAMAGDTIGRFMDIHSGGVDLKFPHHDNELAQSEAYYDSDEWVRYFLHSGHLTIAGCKMSKSLKNFITIEDVLKRYTARQLRFMFLLHAWNQTMDYSDASMERAISYERVINEFFLSVQFILRTTESSPDAACGKELRAFMHETMRKVHEALCDNVDTRTALDAIKELVTEGNAHMTSAQKLKLKPDIEALREVAEYVTEIFSVFGLVGDGQKRIGFGSQATAGNQDEIEDIRMGDLQVLAKFRDDVRSAARGVPNTGPILKLCDQLRDDHLPELGVRLEDTSADEPTRIKLVSKDELLREREQKRLLEAAKAEEKARLKREAEAKKAEQEAKKRMPPQEMFIKEIDKYSQFNDKGIPTHDIKGEPLSASALKKLEKLYAAQEKKYKEYTSKHMNGHHAEP